MCEILAIALSCPKLLDLCEIEQFKTSFIRIYSELVFVVRSSTHQVPLRSQQNGMSVSKCNFLNMNIFLSKANLFWFEGTIGAILSKSKLSMYC